MLKFKLSGRPQSFTKTTHTDVYPAVSPSYALAGAASNLTGSVVITGSGRGIGRSTAHAFAQAGAPRIVITARSALELDEVEASITRGNENVEIIKVVADISNEHDVSKIFKAAGEVEVLMNNAGAFEGLKRFAESDPKDWFRTWDVNVKVGLFSLNDGITTEDHILQGTYLATREFLKQIEAKPRASPVTIINTSSMGSVLIAPHFSACNPSKSALNRFTELTHYEYPETVRAFAYHPGGVNTRIADGLGVDVSQYLTDSPELAAGFALWSATQSSADFLRGRFSSCKWVSKDDIDFHKSAIITTGSQDIDELLAKREEIVREGLLFTVVRGQEPSRVYCTISTIGE
ncbi:hypothetical protein P7C70_g7894, partial [Phenoliferia sp. Uapishka_3]